MTNRFKIFSKIFLILKNIWLVVETDLAVLALGGRRPRRRDLRRGSALALGPAALPECLADLVGGVAGGPHHCKYKAHSHSVSSSPHSSPEEKNDMELLAALA